MVKDKASKACPKCKSINIMHYSNPFYGAPSWKCNECGFSAPGYPPEFTQKDEKRKVHISRK